MRAAPLALTLGVVPLLAGCGGSAMEPHAPVAKAGGDWTRFGYTAARQNAGPAATGITAANVGSLRRTQIRIDGTVDSSPVYLRGARVAGGTHDVLVVTTTYGKTIALDVDSGSTLWTFTPPSYSRLAGTAQITTATPLADRARGAVYAASPDGVIRRLSLATGRPVWARSITRDPTHEKIAAPLNMSRGRLIAATGGYIGDAPPYQGHVVTVDPATGRILHVWNSLCSNRHALIQPSTCPSSDSAIWGRNAVVVDPATGRLLAATGNAPWNGRTDWGDSVVALSPDAARIVGNWTPSNQAELERTDADIGSTSPAILGGGLALQGGKDGKLRLLRISRLNGTTRAGPRTGGEVQTISTPGGEGVFTAPAVWRNRVFVATSGATWAYVLRRGRLSVAWRSGHGGTSPVVAGGLLYVYDPGGALRVYQPATGRSVATLPAGSGHWNSPIVTDGRIALPEGDANAHERTGILDLYRAG